MTRTVGFEVSPFTPKDGSLHWCNEVSSFGHSARGTSSRRAGLRLGHLARTSLGACVERRSDPCGTYWPISRRGHVDTDAGEPSAAAGAMDIPCAAVRKVQGRTLARFACPNILPWDILHWNCPESDSVATTRIVTV